MRAELATTLMLALFLAGPLGAQTADPTVPPPPTPSASPTDTPPPPEPTVPAATVVDAERTEVLAQVPVSGTLVPRQEVQIQPQISGLEIREVLVESGDVVRAGQTLARLDSDTLKAQLAQAEAEVQRAEASVGQARSQIVGTEGALTQATQALERVRKLRASGNAAQAALDQAIAAETGARGQALAAQDGLAVAQAALAQANAARDISRLNLSRTEITAPVAGTVSQRNAELGSLASAGATPLFTLIAGGQVELAAEVIETALPELKVGDPAEITVAGIGAVVGGVRLVPAEVNPVTRLGIMRISLGGTTPLRPGLFASGWVTTSRRSAVTVPSTAVLADGEVARVQVVKDGKVVTREVEAGVIWQGRREIVSGLAEGETVIARAGAFFRDGDAVKAVRATAKPANGAAPEAAASPAPAEASQ